MDDRSFMKMALSLAGRGCGTTSPNPMVGAVVVKEGAVVGRGWHRAVGKAHAEVEALDDAGEKARDSVLYVTLEPCNHTGRTPPCTQKILEAGIRKVVVAMPDPNPDVQGGGNEFLRSRGVDVVVGVCEPEARRLNESFVRFVQSKRPFVTVKFATTLDGRIATRTGDAKWVTGPASRQFVHRIRHAVDAIMVGVGTVNADNPQLTTRIEGEAGRDPVRIVLDTHLSIREDAQMLEMDSDAPTLVVAGPSAPPEKKCRLEDKAGVRVLEAPVRADGLIDLDHLMVILGQRDITSLLIEGGGRLIASALKEDIADKVMAFLAPKILGGEDGVPVCRGEGPALMRESRTLKDVRVRRFADDVMIEGYVR